MLKKETQKNIDNRKKDGRISVEMECSAMQAVCDFRGKELYYFLASDDLLDAPEWIDRSKDKEVPLNHKISNFYIALKLVGNI